MKLFACRNVVFRRENVSYSSQNCAYVYSMQRLSYAKKDSDIIARLKGTYKEPTKDKKKKKKEAKKV